MALGTFEQSYLARVESTHARRMKWWHEARFGMFIHWGLYTLLGRNEWVMNLERIPKAEYEKLAPAWKPGPRPMRQWARLARDAGMKYMVLTTKHHEGFCLWDTAQTPYNSVRVGPQRDLVREYVEACREFGLKVGFYYSLMDWHHPDGIICAKNEEARVRFTQFTQGCVRELLSNYGKIDILWYDVSWPLNSPEAWDSYRLNAMARELQPHILINDRSQLPEDFGTPEEHVTAAKPGRAWEACMTFNGSWGFQQAPPEDWHSVRKVLEMLRTCAAGQGNLLLNVGPHIDGSLPKEAIDRLTAVGKWLKTYGGAIYGKVDRTARLVSATGNWNRKGKTAYYWCTRWPGRELALGAITSTLVSARLYPNGPKLPFKQVGDRLVISGLPEKCPDKIAGVGMIEMVFRSVPDQAFNAGPVKPDPRAKPLEGPWYSEPVAPWRVSMPVPRREGGVAKAQPPKHPGSLKWTSLAGGEPEGFINLHTRLPDQDGLVYLTNRFEVVKSGVWDLLLGHDGGARVFVDGAVVLTEPQAKNPALPGRSAARVKLSKGVHDVLIVFDLAQGKGWGTFFHWGVPTKLRKRGVKPSFPTRVAT